MWTCPKCKENIEDDFDTCWKCAGAAQKAATPPERKRPFERLEYICVMIFIIPPAIAFMQRNDGGDRFRAAMFDLSAMAVGAVGLLIIKIYQHRKARGQNDKGPR